MLNVAVLFMQDGLCSTAVTPLEVFHSAGRLWADLQGLPSEPFFNVVTASMDGGPVRGHHGITLQPQYALADLAAPDIVVISASGLDFDAKLAENAALAPWLKAQHERGAVVAGICSGVLYLGAAGLLDGRMATTHWATCASFAELYPKAHWRPEYFVTEDMRVCCGGGVYAAADLSLYLVEKFGGREMAMEAAKALLLPMPRTTQSAYAMLPVSKPHGDEGIRQIEDYLKENLHRDITTPDLASMAGMAPRTFVRHFKAATGKQPAAYLQALRIEAAKSLLEEGSKPIQAICLEVGYCDLAFFRAVFRRETGMAPGEYRAHFAAFNMSGLPAKTPA